MTTPEKTNNNKTDYTVGPIIPAIIKMGFPSMFGFLVQHIYAIADMFWVSRLPEGESGVAAITFYNNLHWMLFAFNALIGPGSVAIISRRYGEKAYDLVETAIKETILLKLVFGVVLGITGWIYLEDMLYLLGARELTLQIGISYGRILLVGLPIMYATFSLFTAFRGVANPKIAMYLMIASSILNAIADPILIFGYFGLPKLGIEGAAYASVASFLITFLVGLAIFMTNRTNVRLHLFSYASISIGSMWKIVKLGIPVWLGELSFSGSRMLITPIIAAYGTSVVAAYGISMQLFAFGMTMVFGLGMGVSSLIGHNLGAGKPERAKMTADRLVLIGTGLMTLLGIFCYFMASRYMGWFFENTETISIGTEILMIWAIGFPFYGAFIMMEQVHMGVGLNIPTGIASVVQSWGFQVLPAVIATQFLGYDETSVWLILSFSGAIGAFGFYFYYRRGKWLTYKV